MHIKIGINTMSGFFNRADALQSQMMHHNHGYHITVMQSNKNSQEQIPLKVKYRTRHER